MRSIVLALLLLSPVPALAQVQSRPTDAPLVTAVNESWYQLREPLQFAGDVYYPAGPTVFFNGNTMVRTGHYNGVPLYADTTIEPYSVVLVPISRGLMQPYEKLRQGNLAGTTGSRTPSFPVRGTPGAGGLPMVAVPPTAVPQPSIGAINAFTAAGAGDTPRSVVAAVAESSSASAPAIVTPQPVATLMRPESNDGLWVRYMGEKWLSAGAAVVYTDSEFLKAGDYAGFPVYTRQAVRDEMIYIPTRAGLVAPYRLKR